MSKAPPSPKANGKEPARTATAPPVADVPKRFPEGPLLHLLLLALVAVSAYWNTFHGPFVLDDNSSIAYNQVIKDLPAFLSGAGYAYNPRRFVGYLSFALNYAWGGLDTTGYHIFNLAVHICNAWLVYFLVRFTLRTPFFVNAECGVRSAECKNLHTPNSEFRIPNSVLPLLAAALFVAHPVQTQAVTYIVQRLASLATLFYLLALVLYIRARLVQEETGKIFPPSAVALHLLALISAILAMRTKEVAATLPVVVLLYEFSFFGAGARKRLIVLVPLLLTILIVPLGMLQAGKPLGELLSDMSEIARETTVISRGDYLLTQFSVIVTYIRLLFLPVGQNLDYDYPVYHSPFAPRVLFSFLLLCAILAGAGWLYFRSKCGVRYICEAFIGEAEGSHPRRGQPEGLLSAECGINIPENSEFRIPNSEFRLIAFGILWFFITLSVESSIIPISDVIFEHRLYLPSVGAFLALAAAAALLFRNYPPRTLLAASAVVVAVLAVTTWQRNRAWGDILTLCRDVVHKSPNKYRPHNNLGNALQMAGQIDEAIVEFRTALTLKPQDADAYCNLGTAYFQKGWTDQAIEQYLAAVRLNPGHAPAHNNLGEAYNRKELLDKAIESYQVALKLKPDFAEAHYNLGNAYLKKGWTDRAIEEYQSALMLKPNEGNIFFHFNLGIAYEKKGWADKALEEYRLAGTPEAVEALRRLEALSGESAPVPEVPPTTGASTDAEYYSNLGSALNNEGKPDEAIRYLQTALGLNPNNASTYNALGSAYRKKGLKELATQQFLKSVQLDPKLADAHNNLGAAYGEKGLIDQAIEHLEIAVKLNKDDAKALNNLGIAYALKGSTDKAIRHFEAAIALNPKSPDFHQNLAKAYATKGWPDRAEKERSIAGSLKSLKH